jgi:uncharacterized protein DUF2635
MFVKPNAGKIMRDPFTAIPLPPEGRQVPSNTFWRRRVKAGDVVEVKAPAKKKEASKTKASPKSDDD